MTAVAVRGRIDLVAGRPLGAVMAAYTTPEHPFRASFSRLYDRADDWSALASARAGHRLAPPLRGELIALHERLGASTASLDSVRALVEGRALCVVTGQQPAPLGGPLYSFHKTLATVALARALTARLRTPVVPVFWNATEDDDVAEIAGSAWAGPDLAPQAQRILEPPRREASRLVGNLPAAAAQLVWRAALDSWATLPGFERVLALLGPAVVAVPPVADPGDLGDFVSRLFLRAFAVEGLVVLDPRLPAFRDAARPLYARYAERHEAVRDAANAAGDAVERMDLPRGFQPAQTEFALFAAEGVGRRRVETVAAARVAAGSHALMPGALLRPLAQDFVLPSLGLVAGPGEVAYLAQVAAAAQALATPMSIVVPRFSATWLPAPAAAAAAAAGVPVEALVRDPDGALAAFFAAGVPAELSRTVGALRTHARAELARAGDESRALDASLPEFVRATAARLDWRLARLEAGFVKKARRRWKREHPSHPHFASYLKPHQRLQERTLAWLDPIARGGQGVEALARERAAAHVDDLLAGRPLGHEVLAIGEDA